MGNPTKRYDLQSLDQTETSTLPVSDLSARSLLQKQYQDLARQHLGELRQTLFTEVTGLHFHIAWRSLHPTPDPKPLPTPACSICCQLASEVQPSNCYEYSQRHQELAQLTVLRGHRFTCGMGVSNYWFSIAIHDLVVGTAYVQALDKANHILRKQLRQKSAKADARFLSREEFDHAARLLKFIAESAETAVMAELHQTDAARARQAMGALQQEQDRLCEHIHRLMPEEHALPAPPHPVPPPLVHRMLELLHQHYAEPITLLQCARDLGRNASYLSDLFAHAVGLPFKTYLTELRLEKSKELLVDPKLNVSEVALAVGYTSADRFRIVFKQLTGLTPSGWRKMMRSAS